MVGLPAQGRRRQRNVLGWQAEEAQNAPNGSIQVRDHVLISEIERRDAVLVKEPGPVRVLGLTHAHERIDLIEVEAWLAVASAIVGDPP